MFDSVLRFQDTRNSDLLGIIIPKYAGILKINICLLFLGSIIFRDRVNVIHKGNYFPLEIYR